MTLDSDRRCQLIDGVLRLILERYVVPEVAVEIDAAIRARLDSGAYDAIVHGDEFAGRLGEDLCDVSGEGLLVVRFHHARADPDDEPWQEMHRRPLVSFGRAEWV